MVLVSLNLFKQEWAIFNCPDAMELQFLANAISILQVKVQLLKGNTFPISRRLHLHIYVDKSNIYLRYTRLASMYNLALIVQTK